ncbi:MAG: FAD-binding protein [Coriobacteriales bacterium]|nr:FAD-binding protein [Coriobacteriales bacterium]
MSITLNRRDFLNATAGAIGAAALAAGGASFAMADEAPAAAATWSWELPAEPIDDSEIVETIETEVLVVGMGIAGVSAAFMATQEGAQVTILEKTPTFQCRSSHIGAINSQIQKELGFEFDPAQVCGDLTRFQGGYVQQRLIRMYLDNSAWAVDYACELGREAGYEPQLLQRGPEAITTNNPDYREYNTIHVPAESNTNLINIMLEKSPSLDIHYETPAVQLIVEDGKCLGAIAQNADGEYIKVLASKGVVMATGDYAGNPEMMKAWAHIGNYNTGVLYGPSGGNMGDGHRMMIQAGCGMQKSPHAPMVHCLMGANMSPNPWLRVNKYGQRYENEDCPNAQVSYGSFMQPGGKAWCIWDGEWFDKVRKQNFGFGRNVPAEDGEEAYAATMESNIERGLTLKADTLEELAELMEVPVEKFLATVERYNEMCAAGVDVDFGKLPCNLSSVDTPPFYASKIVGPLLVMLGGADVDEHLRVLDTEGNVIENLYAIGNCSGNYYSVDYPAIIGGMSHGRCLTTGYLLGAALAKGEIV